MKKALLIVALAAITLGSQAQERLFLSTYNGTNLSRYDGKVCTITADRYMFTGWNTISLPFAMNEQELNDAFGTNCRLEKLVSADEAANTVTLNFMDCKDGGIEANTPYMLYYCGETGNVKIKKEAEVTNAPSVITLTTPAGDVVTMTGTAKHVDAEGLYGVLARDNAEVRFVSLNDAGTNGFFATRCYIQLSSGTDKILKAQHLGKGEITSINAIAASDEVVDVYNAAGAKIATRISAAEVSNLRPGLYIVKGQKIIVK